MKKDLYNRLVETKTALVLPPTTYTSVQLTDIEKVVKPLLNANELTEYNNLSDKEKSDYLTGFANNIEEWQKAKQQANNPQGGMTPPPGGGGGQQDDGLDHWKPAKQGKDNNSNNGQNDHTNPVFSDAENEVEEAEKQAKLAQLNASNSDANSADTRDPQEIADNASNIAESAKQIADAAQNAADAAQNAADLADINASDSGKVKDIENADKSQLAADAAQDLADLARAAAEKAKEAAEAAQEAANNGDMQEAAKKAKEAAEAAQEAANKASAARLNAKKAINAGKQTLQNNQQGQQSGLQSGQQSGQAGLQSGQLSGQSGQQSGLQSGQLSGQAGQQSGLQSGQLSGQAGQQSGQLGRQQSSNNFDDTADPVLQKADTDFDPNGQVEHHGGAVDLDMPFNGNDFFGDDEEQRDRFKKIAERAGQPLDADDYQTPEEYAGKKYREAMNQLDKWQPHGQPGSFGNRPEFLKEVMARLFASNIDWRTIIEQFMTDKYPENIEDVWAKRRMGVSQNHPFYKGRYLHPNEEREEKRTGLAQVFFLVDASGSMSVTCGDGINIFEHIMSELIQIEMTAKIKRSAYAAFNCGPIYRDDITMWKYEDAMDEEALLEMLELPVASGGTSAILGIQSIQEYDDVYSTTDPWTLLIVVTDGGDYYDGLSEICEDPAQIENMIWVITATGEEWFKSKSKELQALGVPEDHIVCVDINKEWGVDESQVKRR